MAKLCFKAPGKSRHKKSPVSKKEQEIFAINIISVRLS